MTRTDYSLKTKPEIVAIAKSVKLKGYSRMTKAEMIEALVATEPVVEATEPVIEATEQVTEPATEQITKPATEQVTEPATEPASAPIPTATEFYNQVIKLETKLAVHQACNALLDAFCANYTTATISKKLTAYKKSFYAFQHANSDLNESVETKTGLNTQHIAARLLTLSDEQKEALGVDRNERDNARAGFDKNGELRELDVPGIDITAVIKKSLECLHSTDPHTIASGIINLTGLRANEQNMPSRKNPDMDLIKHEMVIIDEFVIGFKGISKKKTFDDANAHYSRVTLAPAQLIVDAHQRYLACKAVRVIPNDYESYRKGFQDTFYNRYCEIFATSLSTVEAFDDDGNFSANGSPHKGRAFYACALRSVLKTAKKFGDSAANKYIQLCLAHESVGITIKYLGRYDESIFINPVDIDIPTSIKGLGKITTTFTPRSLINPTTTANNPKTTSKIKEKYNLDLDSFINALDGELQVKFAELMNSESSLTNAVIALINTAKLQKTNGTVGNKKPSVSDEVADIVEAIMSYNKEQNVSTNCVVPTFALIDKIAQRHFNKSMAKKTIDAWLDTNRTNLHDSLESLSIQGGIFNSQWNGKHHRKDMDLVIDRIITVMNRG